MPESRIPHISTNGETLLTITDSYVNPDFAARYAAAVDEAPYNALYERPAMLALLPPVADCHILDAGCGGGWYAAQLLGRGANVTAIDASATLVEHARSRLSSFLTGESAPLRVRVANLAEPLAFLTDASVDGVISPLVLHYLDDWRPTLREIRRVLKRDGWLLLSTHHPGADAARFPSSPYYETQLVEDDWKWVGKVKFYRRPLTEIASALTDVGFVIERLVEPTPTEAFRLIDPDAYRRLLQQPEFLIVRARVS